MTLPEFSFRTRRHFWQHLKNNQDTLILNVVIVGGGIVGAGVLRELSLQDIPLCFLFEKYDFASQTSGHSSKLIHAGIRYLEQAWIAMKNFQIPAALRNVRFVIEASRERKILGGIAPHLIKPKPIFLVLGEKDKRSALSVLMGVTLYYCLQLLQGQFFPPPKVIFRKKAMEWMAPEIDPDAVKAMFSFWDSETDDARLVIETLQSAHERGGYALNYVEVERYEEKGDLIHVTLRNRESDETITVKTKILVNATGPFVDDIRALNAIALAKKPLLERVAGAHLDVYPAITNDSYYITAGDRRLVFVLKRNEDGIIFSRIGTTERPLADGESPAFTVPTPGEIDYLVSLARDYFPKANIGPDTIVRTDAGVRALTRTEEKNVFLKSREHDIVQEGSIYHVVGVKLTDFRRVSNELLRKIPWDKLHLRLNMPVLSEFAPLRSSTELKAAMYAEADMPEMIRRTMVLHWKDYVEGRRGLGPRVLAKIDPLAFKAEFDCMKDILGWDAAVAEKEWTR